MAAVFDISIDELLQAKEKDKSETVSEEQILQLQEGNFPLINCYEDIVVYSSYMDSPLINRLAEKYMDTITQFEEIFYLLDYFTQETLQKLCLYHKENMLSTKYHQHKTAATWKHTPCNSGFLISVSFSGWHSF